MAHYKIASWNVAGLRACIKKGFYDWVEKNDFDIILLQEVKALEEQLPPEVFDRFSNYHQYYHPAERKGYSGVATWVKEDLKVYNGLGIDEFDIEGRAQQIVHPQFTLFNGYYPNGKRDHSRVPYKLEFSEKIQKLAEEQKRPVMMAGDLNTAHHPIDLANPNTNLKTTGFLPIERAWMDQLENNGWSDLFRLKYPQKKDVYSWWTFRNNCRERNIGWRIDSFWGREVNEMVVDCYYQYEQLGSDHCPVVLELNI